jgi:hypothetical protein
LVANNRVRIDAARLSGDGHLVSGKDLSVALTQDLVNNVEVIANGNLSYGTTGCASELATGGNATSMRGTGRQRTTVVLGIRLT